MRRLLPLASFSSVLLLLGGFVLFVVKISEPLVGAEKRPVARGVAVPDEELRERAPLQIYVALHAGTGATIPQFPVDDAETDDDGRFALRADPAHGERFFVFVRVETAGLETYCTVRPLPPLRAREDGQWEVAATGGPVHELRVELGPTDRCSR